MIKTNLNSLARILRVYSSGLIAAVAFVTIFTAKAAAATPQNLDVKVSVNVSKDLTVSGTYYHFGLLAPNVSSNSATAITITNASGGLIETYTLQGSDAVSEGVGTAWTLAAAVATDTYVLQGQFSSARPANADGNWANDTFTTSAVACSDTQFGNGAPEESGANVSPLAGAKDRNLWFRIKTPSVVSDQTSHKATITIAVQ